MQAYKDPFLKADDKPKTGEAAAHQNSPSPGAGGTLSAFQARSGFRGIKQWGSISHLFSLVVAVLIAVTVLPGSKNNLYAPAMQDLALTEQRQLLLEAMDKIVRYQNYHREINGRYTRDLARLGLPNALSHGSFAEVRGAYEVSVLDSADNHLLVLASGKNDRVTMDERHRVNANFVLPAPSKLYLFEEAERILQLYSQGQGRVDGLYSSYWKLESHIEGEGSVWQAVGTKHPIQGERRQLAELRSDGGRNVASIFNDVSSKVRSRLESPATPNPESIRVPRASEVRLILQRVHQAQHIYKRETGAFAATWEDLTKVTSFELQGQFKESLRLTPFEITTTGYRVSAEGVKGELLGEQFVLDESGQVKQIRYTDSIISKLKESSGLLQGAVPFQISEVSNDASPVLDSKKSGTVQLKPRGSDTPSME